MLHSELQSQICLLLQEYIKAIYCHPAYLTYMQHTSWETLGWKKHKLESRLLGETSMTSDRQMTPHCGRKWIGTEEPLYGSETGEWKNWLKTQYSKNEDHGIRSLIIWQIDEETIETMTDFILGSCKITADGDCSNEIKRCLLLRRKAVTNPDTMLKSRDFATKGPSSQSYGFSSSHIWMWELDYK